MLVRFYWLLAFLAIAVVALGLGGVLDGEQCVKILMGLILALQAMKQGIREARGNGKSEVDEDKPGN